MLPKGRRPLGRGPRAASTLPWGWKYRMSPRAGGVIITFLSRQSGWHQKTNHSSTNWQIHFKYNISGLNHSIFKILKLMHSRGSKKQSEKKSSKTKKFQKFANRAENAHFRPWSREQGGKWPFSALVRTIFGPGRKQGRKWPQTGLKMVPNRAGNGNFLALQGRKWQY